MKNICGQKMFALHNKIKKLELEGRKIIDFSLGDPELDTSKNIINSMKRSLDNKETHYAPSNGIWKLRIAIAEYTEQLYGYKPSLDEIVITTGANMALYLALNAICDKGDRVIFPNTYFPTYMSICESLGLKTNSEWGKTAKVIIINSPCNPTGEMFTKDELEKIYDISKEKGLWIIRDNVYERIVYEEKNYHIPYKKQIIINSLSKSHSMSGFRIGWAIAPKNIIKKMILLNETTVSCVPPFIQTAAVEALKTDLAGVVDDYEVKRDIMYNYINRIDGLEAELPKGAFYLWVNCKKTGKTGKQLAELLLDNGVAVCEGNVFGDGKYFIRLVFCVSRKKIIKGMKIIEKVLNNG